MGLISGLGRSSRGGNGTPLQYSCLENPMDRGAWWATVHEVAKSQTQQSRYVPYVPEIRIHFGRYNSTYYDLPDKVSFPL